MTNEQLVLQIQSNISVQENLETLYYQNHALIYKLVQPYTQFEDEADLMQEAYIGLCKAVSRYDSFFNVAFMTFASFWIRQSVTRYIQNSGSVLRIPVELQQRIYRIQQFSRTFIAEHGREPSTEEISENLGLSSAQVENASIYMQQPRSLDAPASNPEDYNNAYTLEDVLPDESSDFEDTVIEEMFKEQLAGELWQIVEQSLTPKQYNVISSLYRDNLTLEQVGKQHGFSKQRAQQIRTAAFDKLKTGRFHRLLREYAECSGFYYRNSLSDFKRHGSSSVERTAVKEIELQESIREEVSKAF